MFSRLASPKQVAARLPKVSMRYFDFGRAERELVGDEGMIARQVGVPVPFVGATHI